MQQLSELSMASYGNLWQSMASTDAEVTVPEGATGGTVITIDVPTDDTNASPSASSPHAQARAILGCTLIRGSGEGCFYVRFICNCFWQAVDTAPCEGVSNFGMAIFSF